MGIDIMEDDDFIDSLFQDDLNSGTNKVRVNDIRVLIVYKKVSMPNLGEKDIFVTMHSYPYKESEGGLIVISNPIAFVGTKKKEYPTKERLNWAFRLIKQKTLASSGAVLIWDGKILRDEKHEVRRF